MWKCTTAGGRGWGGGGGGGLADMTWALQQACRGCNLCFATTCRVGATGGDLHETWLQEFPLRNKAIAWSAVAGASCAGKTHWYLGQFTFRCWAFLRRRLQETATLLATLLERAANIVIWCIFTINSGYLLCKPLRTFTVPKPLQEFVLPK